MNLRVDRAWKDDKTAAVDDFACIARCADRGDFAVPHADAGLRQSTGREHAAVLEDEVIGLGHFKLRSSRAYSRDGGRVSTSLDTNGLFFRIESIASPDAQHHPFEPPRDPPDGRRRPAFPPN